MKTYRIELNGESTIHSNENAIENEDTVKCHWQNIVDHIDARGGNAKMFSAYAGNETKMSRFVKDAFCVDGICFHTEKLIAEIGGKQSGAVVIG